MSARDRQEILTKALKDAGASLVGFGDISDTNLPFAENFPIAISLAVRYDDKVVESLHMDEEAFYNHLEEINETMSRLMDITETLLSGWGRKTAAMQLDVNVLIKDNEQLRNLQTFPLKSAATRAALGWIGKCALLITPEYGPRVKLAAVLTDALFETAEPIESDGCGRCSLCAESCPYGAIHNINWHKGLEREKLFNAYICNEKRLESVPKLGRKHSCGLCLQACPVGRKGNSMKEIGG